MSVSLHIATFSPLLLVFLTHLEIGASLEFDQLLTGVTYSPWVKTSFNGQNLPYPNNYTSEEIQVMLEVILQRFSKVVTSGLGARTDSYVKNVTYYSGHSTVELYIAEIAAGINRQRGQKSITVLQGVEVGMSVETQTELSLAMESVEKAHEIYPGTMEGFVFSSTLLATESYQVGETWNSIPVLRNFSVPGAGPLKVGIRMGCRDALFVNEEEANGKRKMEKLQEILRALDFVICPYNPGDAVKSQGVEVAFGNVSDYFLNVQRGLLEINGGLDVMGEIVWSSEGPEEWHNLINLREYWKIAGEWARERKFPIWFMEAFDTPTKGNNTPWGHIGWWKLINNSMVNQRDGYLEKILEAPELPPALVHSTPVNTPLILGIFSGLIIFVLLVSLIAVQSLRVKRLKQKLSPEDIRQFLEGMVGEAGATQEGGDNVDTSALKSPYDMSFEIKRDQLKIDYEKILGMGQFGCVFQAVIEPSPEERTEVALKVARDDSSKCTLKGFLSEIKIMMHIGKHPNIVVLIGAYTAELHRGSVYIATELCSLGSLQSFLRKQKKISRQDVSEPIDYLQMLQWSQEIACVMEHLGTKNVVHADLATRNVLLTGTKTAKISDFGLSRRMYNYLDYIKSSQEPLPWRWMAIESLTRSEFSTKSDVWSYGVTLWEIFSMGSSPYPGLGWTTEFVTMLTNGLRSARPAYATPEIYQLMVDCWSPEPEERPSFSGILQTIKNITENFTNAGEPVEDHFYCNTGGAAISV